MSDLQTTKPTRRRQTGRSGLVRLDGLDLRTRQGRAFKTAYSRLIAEFGPEHETEVRELAALRVTIAATQLDTLSADRHAATQARRTLVPLVRLAESLEKKLATTKQRVEPAKQLSAERVLAEIRRDA